MNSTPQQTSRRSRRAKIPARRKIFYSLVVLVVVIGIPEIALRFAGLPKNQGEPAVGTRKFVTWLDDRWSSKSKNAELYQPDSDRLWRLRPGAKIQTVNMHHSEEGESQPITITINPEGYRGPSASQQAGKQGLRVLCLGDSNFFGYPLDDQHAFPFRLQQALANPALGDQAQQDAEVINGGCPGYSVAQGWKWYEESFADYDYDWLLLSYLGNDAWRQPRPDKELMGRAVTAPAWLSSAARSSRLVMWLQSLTATQEEDYVPRVPLDDFRAYYQRFFGAAQQKGARVLILDHNVYPDYEEYSSALQSLAAEHSAVYLRVNQEIIAAFQSPEQLQAYGDLRSQVGRRWGEQMMAQPRYQYLWIYAEVHPEHLNEIGAAWLAQRTARILIEQTQP